MDNLPSKLIEDGIGLVFPYDNSTALKEYIADKTNRTIAFLYLADLPSVTFDKNSKQIITGIDAMKKFVEQLPSEYEEIVRKINSPQWKDETLTWYANWIADRGNHGLANTVSQFIGTNYTGIGTMDELKQIIENTNINGVTQFLKKNWKYWDLVKFIYGYERWKSDCWGGEWESYKYGLPIAFKAFGIPSGTAEHGANFGINNEPYLLNQESGLSEWGVTLPDNVIKQLKDSFLNYTIVTDYANRVSLLSLLDGLLKDSNNGLKWIGTVIRDKTVYLWRK